MKFYPGDIVRYGFGQIQRCGKFPHYEVVCVVRQGENEDRYMCLYVQGDWEFQGEMSINLGSERPHDNELIFTFHPEKHKMKAKRLW